MTKDMNTYKMLFVYWYKLLPEAVAILAIKYFH